MTRALRAALIVLGVSTLSAGLVGVFAWLDVSQGFDERVVVEWQRFYEILAAWLARSGLEPVQALTGAFAIVDLASALVLFAGAYAWARSGLASGPYAWLPAWLAPLWLASGMSGGLFKARALAALTVTSVPADGLQYERAWRLVQPEAFGFLAVGVMVAILGWWLGRWKSARSEASCPMEDSGLTQNETPA